ncbi:MAG: GNAT family N-acetyltransferase, partial [Caldilineaceae bacterium]|nr:GNAT family N-acetyltransferase [Caldilineaceae bacterium]
MSTTGTAAKNTTKDLGHGLILRWSTPADIEKIATLTGNVFRNKEDAPPNVRMMDQMRIIMRGDHPFMTPEEFAVVEETSKPERPLVACTCLWQHKWSYAGIPFTAGRPEFVASLPEYRNRGLIRHIFNLLHERSDSRGDLMQGITGIPYFYRQFGYEMVLDLGARRCASVNLVPEKKEDEQEQCTLRPATVADAPLLTMLHNRNRGDSLLWHEVDEAYWCYLVSYWDDPSIRLADRTMVGMNAQPYMILDPNDNVLGMIVIGHHRWGRDVSVYELALAEGTNLQAIVPSLLRLLRAHGEQAPVMRTDGPPFSQISFQLGCAHPIYALMGSVITPDHEDPYAWYIRVPDVPAFIQHIAPILEARLAQSVLTSHNGELLFDFYRGGLRLVWERGKLTAAEPWRPPT